ncbi:MAG: GntR family transcriptional regulator [Ruminiclostridium sp.]|nr:GntR family transcriptional regulator [Ruminiclostridium sp.]
MAVNMLDEKLPVSLYYQLKEILIKKIKGNEWPVNTRIPTERELCELYRVSRITVRQALDELEKGGYLYRKQGKGTFVTIPKLEQRLGSFYSFSEEIRKMGAVPEANILEFIILESSDRISEILKIERGGKVYGINRLRKADKEPFAVETSYIPVAVAPGLVRESVEKDGLYNTLKTAYG